MTGTLMMTVVKFARSVAHIILTLWSNKQSYMRSGVRVVGAMATSGFVVMIVVEAGR